MLIKKRLIYLISKRITLPVFLMLFQILLIAQGNPSIKLQGKYFGLKPPEMTAELFAKDIISTAAYEHSAPAFSPDGKTVLWGIVERGKPSRLLEMRQKNGVWTAPTSPSFASSTSDDFYPRFSPDGKKLYFSSRRSLPAGFPELKDMWIWVAEKTANGWGEPAPLAPVIMDGTEYAHSVSKKGNLYFSFRKKDGRIFDIAYAKKIGNQYKAPEILGNGINSEETEDGPYVAPNESFLIFESSRAGGFGSNDLFICFKDKNGNWDAPKNMGDKVNTANSERFASLSPDGKYLFFGSDRSGTSNIYWIDAKIIKELKKQAKK